MSATTSIGSRPKSRRALLIGSLGGAGVWAATAIGRASPVRAEGETVEVGGEYTTASSITRIRNETNNQTVFQAESGGAGIGVRGTSDSNAGVEGASGSGVGVHGSSTSAAGIQGFSGSSFGVYGSSASNVGVRGFSSASIGVSGLSDTSKGVSGVSGTNVGVEGSSNTGVGVHAESLAGYALEATGRAKFSTSGVATIAAGLTSATVSPPVDVTAASFVLLTPKNNLGARSLWFTIDTTANTFSIRMSAARSTSTRVAWLLLG